MAKKEKEAPKASKKDKAETKAAAPEFKYGVADLADKLGIKEASVRVQLRNKGIEKAGKSYGWNTKAELEEVIDELKAEKPAKATKKATPMTPRKKSPKKAKKDEKPAKKAKAKKPRDEDDEDDD